MSLAYIAAEVHDGNVSFALCLLIGIAVTMAAKKHRQAQIFLPSDNPLALDMLIHYFKGAFPPAPLNFVYKRVGMLHIIQEENS